MLDQTKKSEVLERRLHASLPPSLYTKLALFYKLTSLKISKFSPFVRHSKIKILAQSNEILQHIHVLV